MIDSYRNLFDLCKRCLMNGSERMIEFGKKLIRSIIEKYQSKRGIAADMDILFELLLTNETYTH